MVYDGKTRGVARGGPGVPMTPLCKPCFKQTTFTTGGKNEMKIWRETSFWQSVNAPLKNTGYAPGENKPPKLKRSIARLL